jgi:hypothetical protein
MIKYSDTGLNKNDWIAAGISLLCLGGTIAATIFAHLAQTQRTNGYNQNLHLRPPMK